jgi:hypothetical protein
MRDLAVPLVRVVRETESGSSRNPTSSRGTINNGWINAGVNTEHVWQ